MYKFTAQDNYGLYEEFTGYDSLNEAIEGIERLRKVGYIDFSFPDEYDWGEGDLDDDLVW